MDLVDEFFKDRKTLTNLVILLVLVVLLPIGINLARNQQILRSKAAASPVEITEGDCVEERNGKKVLICPEVPLKITSPIGRVEGVSRTNSPRPTPSRSPSPYPSPSFAALPPGCSSTTKTPDGRVVVNSKNFPGIQAALDCFKNNDTGGGAVYIPSGTYTVTDKIRVYSNVTLFGDGIDKTILQLDSTLLSDPGGIMGNDTNYGHKNIAIREMTLKGLGKESGALNCCPGIILRQLEKGFLDNIKVEGFSWHGIYLAYKKQTSGNLDTVKSVRISNCQILNNKGAGVEMDSPTSYSIVDHCTLSGNNHGVGGDKNGGAAINFFMDEDGLVTKNKVLNNIISNNSGRGVSLVARNNITAIKTTKIFNNSVCNNTIENNKKEGITDGNSEKSYYIANKINNNNDKRDGKVQTGSLQYWDFSTLNYFTTPIGSSLNMVEDESPTATSPDCAIPDLLRTIPPLPTKPTTDARGKPSFSLVKSALAQTPDATRSASPSPSAVYTAFFKVAETEAGLKDAEEITYDDEPTIFYYELENLVPGFKQIWVEFENSEGKTLRRSVTVELVELEPELDQVSCKLDLTEQSIVFDLKGDRFGRIDSSEIVSGDEKLRVLELGTKTASAVLDNLEFNTDPGEQIFSVKLKRSDGSESEEVPCKVGIAQLSLGTDVFCKEKGKNNVSNVNLTFIDASGNKTSEIVSIDESGLIRGLKTKLEIGKRYLVSIKPSNGLRRNTEFTAGSGTIIIKDKDGINLSLPLGDIAPQNGGDGAINSADKLELNRQWTIRNAASLSGDINTDGKVNSIDWACMRHNFGLLDQPLPAQASSAVEEDDSDETDEE